MSQKRIDKKKKVAGEADKKIEESVNRDILKAVHEVLDGFKSEMAVRTSLSTIEKRVRIMTTILKMNIYSMEATMTQAMEDPSMFEYRQVATNCLILYTRAFEQRQYTKEMLDVESGVALDRVIETYQIFGESYADIRDTIMKVSTKELEKILDPGSKGEKDQTTDRAHRIDATFKNMLAKQGEGEEEEEDDDITFVHRELRRAQQEIISLLKTNVTSLMKTMKKRMKEGATAASTEVRRAVILRLLNITNEFEQKDHTVDTFYEDAKTALNTLVEAVEVFGYSKEEITGSLPMKRIEAIRVRYALSKQTAELEALKKRMADNEKEMGLLARKVRENMEKKEMERQINDYAYRAPPQDPLTCHCHTRMSQFFCVL
ncbi:hypothetical protein PENTCL1PPCAC_19197 [Pristionchus entomophagus]|uniref:Uncharacterized protein n=1 Tax=Pristionchus entomophagus TaxID=358040 RepID=A0AAV5TS70_9BILA|nr:hypothetical protein PENTCL1PPCAC_19197 [Pristionchus entomophagus]